MLQSVQKATYRITAPEQLSVIGLVVQQAAEGDTTIDKEEEEKGEEKEGEEGMSQNHSSCA